ncbi:MAG: hypothetical protein BWY10_02486 [Chloroflexi bacterium ADurb.Bin180]|nr:MAG: hypothetical protein BWY10_02486 [Chloroflexi bacterium ADurb.Bin180]
MRVNQGPKPRVRTKPEPSLALVQFNGLCRTHIIAGEAALARQRLYLMRAQSYLDGVAAAHFDTTSALRAAAGIDEGLVATGEGVFLEFYGAQHELQVGRVHISISQHQRHLP